MTNLQQFEEARRDELAAQRGARQAAKEAEQQRRDLVIRQIVVPGMVASLAKMYDLDGDEIAPFVTAQANDNDKWGIELEDGVQGPASGMAMMDLPGHNTIIFPFGIDTRKKYFVARHPSEDPVRGDGPACHFMVITRNEAARCDHLGDALIAARIPDDEVTQ